MKFLYGFDKNNYIDITKIVFEKCVNDTGIYIKAGESERCQLIGYDPYPNILKHILVVDNYGNRYPYLSTKDVNISFDSLCEQLVKYKNPKVWWNSFGKFISDPVERLEALQKHINLGNLPYLPKSGFEAEYPEQLMCIKYINENDKVLEIGGNIGRTAHIIHTIINNPQNHIVMECNLDTAKKLRDNLNINNYHTLQIETNVLSKIKLYNLNGFPRPADYPGVTSNNTEMPTITYQELCSKYNINFNVIVADCEGSLYYIFKEDPDILNNIHTIIMENDYVQGEINKKETVDNILKSKGFTCIYTEKGVPEASWSCCFDNFYEVWKK